MTSWLPTHPGRAATHGLLFWLVGMIVGSVVFAVPGLKAAAPIPSVSANPFISIPIIAVWAPLAYVLARRAVAGTLAPAAEGLRLGVTYLAVNALLDLVLVVGVMGAGSGFYAYAALWVAYALLLIVPWTAGRAAARAALGR